MSDRKFRRISVNYAFVSSLHIIDGILTGDFLYREKKDQDIGGLGVEFFLICFGFTSFFIDRLDHGSKGYEAV